VCPVHNQPFLPHCWPATLECRNAVSTACKVAFKDTRGSSRTAYKIARICFCSMSCQETRWPLEELDNYMCRNNRTTCCVVRWFLSPRLQYDSNLHCCARHRERLRIAQCANTIPYCSKRFALQNICVDQKYFLGLKFNVCVA